MFRSMVSKVAWVGRTASMVFGLALVAALIFGAAGAALGATGGNFILGKANAATTVSKLTASITGPALTLVNQSTDDAATALNINVSSGNSPLKVNAAAGTAANLSADELDGMDASELEPRGYAQVNHNGPALVPGSSKGVISVERTSQNVYCFDLEFVPKAAVASAHLNNNATVGTLISPTSGCTAPHTDAAAKVYGGNDSSVHSDVSFGIVFM